MAARVIRLGILSTARVGGAIVHAARSCGELEVVAIASRDADRARAVARAWGVPRAHAGYEALLADPGVDAVHVALPNALHVPWTVRALEAGKHVLCEKPVGRRAGEVAAAAELARERGLVLAEGFMYRHHPQTARLRALVSAGALGRPALVRGWFSFAVADPADPRLRRDLDGGALMDVGCYAVSAARLLLGEPVRAHAERLAGGDGVDLRLAGTLAFAGGAGAVLDCAIDLPPRHGLEVVGEEGVAFVADPWHCRAPGIELRRGDRAERIAIEPADPYALELRRFAGAVAAGAPTDAAELTGQARAIEALLRSAEDGGAVRLPDPAA